MEQVPKHELQPWESTERRGTSTLRMCVFERHRSPTTPKKDLRKSESNETAGIEWMTDVTWLMTIQVWTWSFIVLNAGANRISFLNASWSFLNRSIYRSCLHFALQFHVVFQFHLPFIQFFLKLLVVLRIVDYSPLSLPTKWLTMSNNLCKRKVFLKMAAQVNERLTLQPSDWKASFLRSSTLFFYNMMVENPKGSELFFNHDHPCAQIRGIFPFNSH